MSDKIFSNKHFDIDEMKNIRDLVNRIIEVIQVKINKPSIGEEKQFEGLPDKSKLLIKEVMRFRNEEPALSSGEIDWTAFYNNYADIAFIKSIIFSFQSIMKDLSGMQLLLALENYQIALKEFEYTESKKNNDVRMEAKYEVLKQYL